MGRLCEDLELSNWLKSIQLNLNAKQQEFCMKLSLHCETITFFISGLFCARFRTIPMWNLFENISTQFCAQKAFHCSFQTKTFCLSNLWCKIYPNGQFESASEDETQTSAHSSKVIGKGGEQKVPTSLEQNH